MDGVIGLDHPAVFPERFAGIGVWVEAGKHTARDVEADSMSLLEHVRRRKRPDGDWIDAARFDQLTGLPLVAPSFKRFDKLPPMVGTGDPGS